TFKVDHNFSNSDTMFVRYLFDDSDQVLPRNFPEFPNLALNNKQVLTAEETKIITKNIVNEARFGFNHSTPQEAVPRTSRSLALISGKEVADEHSVGVGEVVIHLEREEVVVREALGRPRKLRRSVPEV